MRGTKRLVAMLALLATLGIPWAVSSHDVALAAPNTNGSAGFAGTAGELMIERRGSWRELTLPSPSTNADVRVNVNSNKVATGLGQTIIVVARRVSARNEYRARVRFMPDGSITVAVIRFINGSRRIIARAKQVPGVTHRPGSYVAIRVRVDGNRPTTIGVRVWTAGMAEPSGWSQTVTDNAPELAHKGWLGLRFGVSMSSTNVPVRYQYDRVQVESDGSDATPDPSTTPTPSPTPSGPAPTPTPSPTPSPSPTTFPANSFFVSPTGNDSGPGSEQSPWRTVQKAANVVGAGAHVFLRAGNYSAFAMRRSGTAGAPITFTAYPGESAIIDGHDSAVFAVQLTGVKYVNLVGLTVQGGYAERHYGGGVMIANSSYVSLTDNLLRDNKAFGVRSSASTHVTIDSNDITGNAVGVHITGPSSGTVVSNNLIHENTRMMVNTADVPGDDAGGEAVALVKSTGSVIVRKNLIWGNRSPSYDFGWDGGAFSIYGASGWTITENITWDNRNVLETGTDAAKTPCNGNTFTRNLNYGATTEDKTVGMVLRCGANMLVANNTFSGVQSFIFSVTHNAPSWGASIEGMRIVNNVISSSTGTVFGVYSAMPASVVIDNNVVQVTGNAILASVVGTGNTNSMSQFETWTGYQANGLQSDPRFMNTLANDYRLRSDSPAVDAGLVIVGVSDDFDGAGPDVGYHERP